MWNYVLGNLLFIHIKYGKSEKKITLKKFFVELTPFLSISSNVKLSLPIRINI